MSHPTRSSQPIVAPRQMNIRAVWIILAAIVVLVVILGFFDDVGVRLAAPDSPAEALTLANALARSSVQLISAILAALFLAIPLTANMYTPQLIDLFVRSWTNRIVLSFFVFTCIHAVWMCRLVGGDDVPVVHLTISLWLFTISLAVILPYLFSVFRFLDPDTIIQRVAARLTASMTPHDNSRETETETKERLARRIHNLGNICLKAIERSDRNVALAAASALGECAYYYQEVRKLKRGDWFVIEPQHFPGLSKEAIALVNRERNWVELEILTQLSRVYDSALARTPDVLSAVSRGVRRIALASLAAGNEGGFDISIRFFNNFLREAAKKKAIHALYDVTFQYRGLALETWPQRPEGVVRMCRYLDYYGKIAAANGIPFAQDIIAYDIGSVITHVDDRSRPEFDQLVAQFLDLAQTDASTEDAVISHGILKARLIVAATLREQGEEERARLIEESLSPLPVDRIQRAGTELLSETDEAFWEVTDRQKNLDYLPPAEKEHLEKILTRLGRGRRPTRSK